MEQAVDLSFRDPPLKSTLGLMVPGPGMVDWRGVVAPGRFPSPAAYAPACSAIEFVAGSRPKHRICDDVEQSEADGLGGGA